MTTSLCTILVDNRFLTSLNIVIVHDNTSRNFSGEKAKLDALNDQYKHNHNYHRNRKSTGTVGLSMAKKDTKNKRNKNRVKYGTNNHNGMFEVHLQFL